MARSGSDPLDVEVVTVQRVKELRSFVTASGEIVATRYADLGSATMGRLVALTVKEGDRVKAGQVLARIDPIQAASSADAATASVSALESDARAAATAVQGARAARDEATTRAAEAAAALRRVTELRQAGVLSAAEFDKVEASANAAQSQVAAATASIERAQQAQAAAERRIAQGRAERTRARDQLDKTRITAPIDGVITRLDVEEGEMVVMGVQNQPGTILMTISDLSAINAEVKVAEADVMRLATGLASTVTFEALPGQRFPGRVIEIGASALPQIGTQAAAREFRVKVQLDPTTTTLRPGLTCDAEILAAERRNVLVVPLQAVVERNGATGVFAMTSGAAVFTPVTTGIIGGLSIEIDGIAENREIVSGPFQALRELQDGAPVRARK